jgi:tetraacyldisaccharide 4'-kinase
LFTQDFVLPTGNLREPRSGSKRANAILVTKCPLEISTEERQRIVQKIAPTALQQVFFTKISYAPFVVSESDELPIASLRNYAVVLLTGIANPKPLLAYLTTQQVDFIHLSYPDHHSFDAADLQTIQKTFAAVEGEKKLLLTTEKDAMRLQGKLEGIYALGIQTDFIEGQKDFDMEIRNNIDTFH